MSQMDRFAESLLLYAQGRDLEVRHYPGQYTKAMALDLAKTIPLDTPLWFWAKAGGRRMRMAQEQDLRAFGVEFDTWAAESHLHGGGNARIEDKFTLGLLWERGVNGPICGNCAHPLQWMEGKEDRECHWCPLCSGQEPYRQPWEGFANPLSSDPALHPDNDFMPEPTPRPSLEKEGETE